MKVVYYIYAIMQIFAKLYKQMKVFNKEITKLNSNFEKIYHLLETHFAPRPMEVIVPDPGPAVDKGLHMHIKY